MCKTEGGLGDGGEKTNSTLSGRDECRETNSRMLDSLLDAEEVEKRSSELWQIHGKHFDLSGFLQQHPVRRKRFRSEFADMVIVHYY